MPRRRPRYPKPAAAGVRSREDAETHLRQGGRESGERRRYPEIVRDVAQERSPRRER